MSWAASFIAGIISLASPEFDAICHRNCQLSDVGISVISKFEGYSPYVYKDSAGLATIGIGHLIKPGEKFDEPLMPDEAHELLRLDAAQAVKGVNRQVAVPLKQHQADALISFTFNVGEGALKISTLLKFVNNGRHAEAPEWFLPWNKVTLYGRKVPIKGLTTRRQAEAMLYAGK